MSGTKATKLFQTGGYALLFGMLLPYGLPAQLKPAQQRTANGVLEGAVSADGKVRGFKGIPYAAPPVGALRWQAPQPAAAWTGVRKATEFGARCMQNRIYADMVFHDAGPNEDCLYLNVWLPAEPAEAKLPVMVWIYGGGYMAGAASEPRQDGGNLSKKGVVVVSMNYRLGVFGFFAHPELSKESGHGASGNYGLMDQLAALKWVKENIAAFGGDPGNVTIFGESAGSISVSALMASPLAKGLFQRAIGESGALLGDTMRATTLAVSEKAGEQFGKAVGAETLEALRAKPAGEILQAASKPGAGRFSANIDGYFLPEPVDAIFAAGKQNDVTLLAGWNSDEGNYRQIFGEDAATPENFAAHAKTLYGDRAEGLLKVYLAETAALAKRSASDLAGDRFIAFSTWKWTEMQLKTGKAPVYRYHFEQTMPLAANAPSGAEATAPHASEIEFVFGMLGSKDLPWRPEDRKLSELMGSYWTNFARTGDPNGAGLPKWPVYAAEKYEVMHLKAEPGAAADELRGRYLFLDGGR